MLELKCEVAHCCGWYCFINSGTNMLCADKRKPEGCGFRKFCKVESSVLKWVNIWQLSEDTPPAAKHWKAEFEHWVLMYQWNVIMLTSVVVGVITSQDWVCLIFYNCRYCYCYHSWYEQPASKSYPHRPQSQTQQAVVLSEKAVMNLRYTTYQVLSSRQTKNQ